MILLVKHRFVILATLAVVTVMTIAGLKSLPETYTASAKVLIQMDQQAIPSFYSGISASREATSTDNSNRRLEDEMQLMQAYPLAAAVVKQLGLTYDTVYHPPYVHLLSPVADLYDDIMANFFGITPDPERHGFVATAKALRDSLTVEPAPSKSADASPDVIVVSLKGVNPALAQSALSRLLEIYTDYDRRMNQEMGAKAFEIIDKQVEAARKDVLASQGKIESFIGSTGMVPRRMAGNAAPASGSTRAKAGAAAADARPLSLPGDTTPVQVLKSRLTDMEVALVDLQQNYPGKTEQIRALKNSIEELNGRLDQEQKRTGQNEGTLMGLERNLQLAETVYLELRKRLSEVALFIDMNAGQTTSRVVVDPPLLPRESNWQTRVLLAFIGSVGGLLLGIAFVGMLEHADHRLQSESDVLDHIGIPVLAVVPRTRLRRRRRGSTPKDLAMTRKPAHV